MDNYALSSLNGFAAQGIDRATARRKDERWIADRLKDPTTRFLPLWNLKNLVTDASELHPVLFSISEIEDFLSTADSITFLGEDEEHAYFSFALPLGGPTPEAVFERYGKFEDLRKVAGLLKSGDAGLLAHARGMAHWHVRHRFCGDCGSPTKSIEAGYQRICTNKECGQLHFPRTDPAIIVMVTRGEKCLLGRQPIWPKGMYSTIAGFVEPGESLEEAVAREVLEETGIEAASISYRSSQPWPFPSSLMLGFNAKTETEEIRLDDKELEDARWFSREEIQKTILEKSLKLPPSISIAYRLIEDWFDSVRPWRLKEVLSNARNA